MRQCRTGNRTACGRSARQIRPPPKERGPLAHGQGEEIECCVPRSTPEAPYREACRKAGTECEFAGAKAAPVAPRVRFLVERVKGGIKVAVKGRPETEETIPDAALKESVGKAADAYVTKFIGDRSVAGNKAAGLGQRFRIALAKS